MLFLDSDLSRFIVVGSCFLTIFLNDIFDRKFGAGSHDQVGIALYDIIFYISLAITGLFSLILIFNLTTSENSLRNITTIETNQVTTNILFIVGIGLFTQQIFYHFIQGKTFK